MAGGALKQHTHPICLASTSSFSVRKEVFPSPAARGVTPWASAAAAAPACGGTIPSWATAATTPAPAPAPVANSGPIVNAPPPPPPPPCSSSPILPCCELTPTASTSTRAQPSRTWGRGGGARLEEEAGGAGAVQRTGTNQPLQADLPASHTKEEEEAGGAGAVQRTGTNQPALRARPPRLTHFGAGEQHRALGLADIVRFAGHVALVHPEVGGMER